MLSKLYKFNNHLYVYDYDKARVYWVFKMSEEDKESNEEWMAKYKRPLYDVVFDDYAEVATVGLRKENWDNKEARDEYLSEWGADVVEEISYLL